MYIEKLKIKDILLDKVQEEVDNQKYANEEVHIEEILNNVINNFSIEKILEMIDNNEESFFNLSDNFKEKIAERIYYFEIDNIKDEIISNINNKEI